MPKKVKEEKPHHKQAYELYFLLPPEKRSIREVARQLGKSPSTVQSWAESFNWKERAEIRDSELSRQFQEIQKENNDTLLNVKASFHKILKALIAQAIADIKDGELKIYNVNDLIKVMELDMALLGEVDRQASSQMDALTEALKQSAQIFGMDNQEWEYDGKDRIEGEDIDKDQ